MNFQTTPNDWIIAFMKFAVPDFRLFQKMESYPDTYEQGDKLFQALTQKYVKEADYQGMATGNKSC
jgi:hypothetical protein